MLTNSQIPVRRQASFGGQLETEGSLRPKPMTTKFSSRPISTDSALLNFYSCDDWWMVNHSHMKSSALHTNENIKTNTMFSTIVQLYKRVQSAFSSSTNVVSFCWNNLFQTSPPDSSRPWKVVKESLGFWVRFYRADAFPTPNPQCQSTESKWVLSGHWEY